MGLQFCFCPVNEKAGEAGGGGQGNRAVWSGLTFV